MANENSTCLEFTTQPDDLLVAKNRGSVKLTVHVVQDETRFLSLRRDWEDLESSPSTSIFQTFDWQFLWWKHFVRTTGVKLFVLVFREKEFAVAIAPFILERHKLGGFRPFKIIKFMGSGLGFSGSSSLALDAYGPSDYADLIIRPGFKSSVGTELLSFLKSHSDEWDQLNLQNIPQTGHFYRVVMPFLRTEFQITEQAADVCPKIILPDTVDGYLSTLTHRVRRKLRYSQKVFLNSPDCKLERIEGGELSAFMQMLERLHQSRWNSTALPGLFADRRFTSMQIEFADVLNRKGKLWFKIISQRGRPIAARLAFKHNRKFYDYLSGFERSYEGPSTASPEYALLYDMISEAIESGTEVVDMLRGDEEYKFGLTSIVGHNRNVIVISSGLHGTKTPYWFRLSAGLNKIRSRIACEIAIFKLVNKKRNAISGITFYTANVLRRLGRSSKFPHSAGKASTAKLADDGLQSEFRTDESNQPRTSFK